MSSSASSTHALPDTPSCWRATGAEMRRDISYQYSCASMMVSTRLVSSGLARSDEPRCIVGLYLPEIFLPLMRERAEIMLGIGIVIGVEAVVVPDQQQDFTHRIRSLRLDASRHDYLAAFAGG